MQPRSTPDSKSTPEKIAITLAEVRHKLGKMAAHRFPHYINKTTLWADQSQCLASPVQETDPVLVRFCKHSLSALRGAEQLALIAQEYTNRSLARKVISAGSTLYKAYHTYHQEFSVHLDALTKMAERADLPKTIRDSIDTITTTLIGLNFDQLRAGQVPAGAKKLSNKLDKEFLNLMDSYVEVQRPVAPKSPEKNYKQPAETTLEDKRSEIIRLLEPATVLLEPINTGLLFAGKMHNRLDLILHEDKSRGIYTEEEILYIEKTTRALFKPPIDEKGFLKEDAEETDLSKMMKLGFNVLWSVNKVCTNPDPGSLTYINAIRTAKPYLDKLKELILKSQGLKKNMQALYDTSIKALLGECRDLLFPPIENLTKKIHEFELQNHLRYGSLLDEFRQYFDDIETLFIQNGVPFNNPLGNVALQEKELDEKLRALKIPYEKSHEEGTKSKFIAQQLKLIISQKAFNKTELMKQLAYLKALPNIETSEASVINKVHTAITKGTIPPPTELQKVITITEEREKKASKSHATLSLEYMSLIEAQQERKKIKMEFFSRTLAKQGVNYYLRATRAALDNKHINVNSSQKRMLARLYADYENKDSLPYLLNAHATATDLLKHPEKLKQMALDIHSRKTVTNHAHLGHELAIELTLCGYVNPNDWENNLILNTVDPDILRKDFINAMTRIETNQIMSLHEDAAKGDENAIKRLGLFSLLATEKMLSVKKVNQLLSGPPRVLSMTAWIKQFVDRYHQLEDELKKKEEKIADKSDLATWRLKQPERRLMNAIGLFLGRIANNDPNTAKIVFEQAKIIIKSECLVVVSELLQGKSLSADLLQIDILHSDKALYYESLVKTLDFDTIYTNQTYQQFIEKNKNAILAIHREANTEQKDISPSEIMEFYKSNPLALCQLTERFITTCLSSGSRAETELRNFFSAMTLCQSEESKLIRQNMFNLFIRMGRSVRAPYIILLTKETSGNFWKNIQIDMQTRSISDNAKLDDILGHMLPLLNKLPVNLKKKFTDDIIKFINDKKTELKNTFDELKKEEKDVLRGCGYALQEIEKILESAKKQEIDWSKEALKQMITEYKNEFIKNKAAYIKTIENLMDNKVSNTVRHSIMEKINNYQPETELLSTTITNIDEAERAIEKLVKLKAELSSQAKEKFDLWAQEVKEESIKHAHIKDLKVGLDESIKIFDKSVFRSSADDKKLEPYFNQLNPIKDIFKNPDHYWSDAAKLYGAIENMKIIYSQSKESKRHEIKNSDPLVKTSVEKMEKEINPKLESIGKRLHQQLEKWAADKRPDLIEEIIKHFPSPKTESNLSARLEFSSLVIKNLKTLIGSQDILENLPDSQKEFKDSAFAELQQCFVKQNEIIQKLSELKSDFRTAYLARDITQEQVDLKKKASSLMNHIIKKHCDLLIAQVTEQFHKLKEKILNQMIGKVTKEFKDEMLIKINSIDPTQTMQDFFAIHKPSNIDIAKEILPLFSTQAQQEIDKMEKQFQLWSTQYVPENTRIITNEVKEFTKTLKQIMDTLSHYLKSQGKYAFIYSAMNLPLRGQKMGIASECLTKLKEIDEAISESPEKLSESISKMVDAIKELENQHNVRIKGSEKKAGSLQLAINKIKDMERPLEAKWEKKR